MGDLQGRNLIDHARININTSVVSLANASPTLTAGATVRRMVMTITSGDCCYREDASDPSATYDHVLYAGDALQYMDANYESLLKNLRFLAATTNAKGAISYYD